MNSKLHHAESPHIKITFAQAFNLLVPYIKKRVGEQLKSVIFIIIYLMVFQTTVLRVSIEQASIIAIGLSLVVIGLTFFIEGLFLGIMPLGETIGIKLPRKTSVPAILLFSFILGVIATLAEPTIGILRAAGNSVKPWDTPLLFLFLNLHPLYLVMAVGIGVGIAVACGMLRFIHNWSLKPFILFPMIVLLGFSLWAAFEPNMRSITGLAWDCGGITTGPVTVPLVLALGIGICRVVGSASSGAAGFGLVTLASLYPVLAVMLLGLPFLHTVPQPSTEVAFASPQNREKSVRLFTSEEQLTGYVLRNGSTSGRTALFNNDTAKLFSCLEKLVADGDFRSHVLGPEWSIAKTEGFMKELRTQLQAHGKAGTLIADAAMENSAAAGKMGGADLLNAVVSNIKLAVRAIIPLCLFLALVLLLLKERAGRRDEMVTGVLFALVGLGLFNVGMELGLAKIGSQTGAYLPSTFKKIELAGENRVIQNFDTAIVATAITADGGQGRFFTAKFGQRYEQIPYSPDRFDEKTKEYLYTPERGPVNGKERGVLGFSILFLFALIMGYGATLAEPALTTLGIKVEELTVGIFKQGLLKQSAAIGVGLGMAFGLVKILWDIPVIYLLIPPYCIALVLTLLVEEEFANIAWDSAGVTTGPVTVPLVLAMGIGISSQLHVDEGFGVIALASVWPILSVLVAVMIKTWQRKSAVKVLSNAQTGAEQP